MADYRLVCDSGIWCGLVCSPGCDLLPGWCVRKCLMAVLLPGGHHNCRGRTEGREWEVREGSGEKVRDGKLGKW